MDVSGNVITPSNTAMKIFLIPLLFTSLLLNAQIFSPQEINRWQMQNNNVQIIRDNWGVPHIYGKTDADAVFGFMYAQCEDNFQRLERNYITLFGRLSEVDEDANWLNDLKMRMIYDTIAAKKDYERSPAWLKKLLVAFADGINFYLYKHPNIKPEVFPRFEPWFHLMFTDGGVTATRTGGIQLSDIQNLYDSNSKSTSDVFHSRILSRPNEGASNAFAIAPAKTTSKNALLYINPHAGFYFRTEMHMNSEEGLNVYGAVTWGNIFVFHGFNQFCGWAHTTSFADGADLYEEKISKKDGNLFYEYNGQLKAVQSKQHVFVYKQGHQNKEQSVTVYYTHHGPVMGSRNGKWLSLKENNRSLNGLLQSWLRMKAKNLDEFKKVMSLRGNQSNNTTYADSKGNIAYWHGNFIPKKNTRYNWALPVDGSISETEWKGIHELNEIIHYVNPNTGFLQNCNSSPFYLETSGKNKYPIYMAPEEENPRSVTAVKLLKKENAFTIEKLIAVGYDPYLATFDILLPPLFVSYDETPSTDTIKELIREPIALLKSWDRNASVSSVAATIAIEWTYKLLSSQPFNDDIFRDQSGVLDALIKSTSPQKRLKLLADAMTDLQKAFGTWRLPWGEINRYQRLTGNIKQKYDDSKPSIPVPYPSALFGPLAPFEAEKFNTKKDYGYDGNSFVAAIEFGKKIKAKSILTGGQSFDPQSKHFMDQAQGCVNGTFKDVWFYKADVLKNAETIYHLGDN
jgi:acyl-homoserine lactone acylase PvdQ